MTWDEAATAILGLTTRDRLRNADGTTWHVRGVLPADERAVVRRWYSGNRMHCYVVVDAAALVVGLYAVMPRRRRKV